MWRQLVETTAWNRRPRHRVRDRDAVSGGEFAARATGLGIETDLTPVCAPRATALAERVVRTLRNECLEHVIVLHEAHRRAVLREYATYDTMARPHRSLGRSPPLPGARRHTGPIRARPILGGLHHVYEGAA